MKVDKVTLEILANHCRAAAESMAYTLYRTAHSTFVKETEDFTIQILDAAGRTGRRADGPRRDLVSRPRLRPRHPDDLRLRAGRHRAHQRSLFAAFSPRIRPTSCCGSRSSTRASSLCFAAGHIHNTDMGGAVPASLSRALTEIHQEGIRFQPTKLYRAGVLNQELLDVMMTNVRKPDLNVGDLKALRRRA